MKNSEKCDHNATEMRPSFISDHSGGTNKMVDHVAEVGNMVPLTLEQLRQIDGKCVKVVVDGVESLEMLALVEVPKDEDCVLLRNNLGGVSEFYNDDDLREDGVKAYAYPPAHIDLEAWKECPWCKAEYTIIDDDFGQPVHPNMVKFCWSCGRPLTPDAREMLEKRLRG